MNLLRLSDKRILLSAEEKIFSLIKLQSRFVKLRNDRMKEVLVKEVNSSFLGIMLAKPYGLKSTNC